MQYKCANCFLGYIDSNDVDFYVDGRTKKATANCPECGGELEKHCEKDVPCHCGQDIHETVKLCDVCGEPVCPKCGCHDVAAISRITGYMSDYGGWSAGKKAEFKDRYRVEIE